MNKKLLFFKIFLDTIQAYPKDFTLQVKENDHGRRQIAGTLFELTQHHARATLILLENEVHPSALALQRTLQETAIRGHWILHCASHQAIENFRTKDKLLKPNGRPYSIRELVYEIEANRGWVGLM